MQEDSTGDDISSTTVGPAAPDTDALIALLVTGGSSGMKVRSALTGRKVIIPAQVVAEFRIGPGPRETLLGAFASDTDVILGLQAPAALVARYVAAGLKPGDAAIAAAAKESGAQVITFDEQFARSLQRLGEPVVWLRHD
jgi:rRNA-processing protein FCF1